jgi:hypothetical protein
MIGDRSGRPHNAARDGASLPRDMPWPLSRPAGAV